MKKHKNYTISDFYCTKCGSKGISVARKPNQCREPGHLKKLYCTNCEKIINHAEVRPIFSDYNLEDFYIEFRYKNFDKNGNRIEPYRILRGRLKQKGMI